MQEAVISNNEQSTKSHTSSGVISRSPDKYIWGIFIMLCICSIIETFSASSQIVSKNGILMTIVKPLLFLSAGTIIVATIQRVPYQKFLWFIPVFGLCTLALLGVVEQFGENVNGAKRAIYILGFSLQPAEMAKIGVVLLIAWIMGKFQMPQGVRNIGVILSAGAVGFFGFFILKQGLTNTLMLMAISISMMLICGVQLKKLMWVLVIYGIMGSVFFYIKFNSDEIDSSSTIQTVQTNGNPNEKEVDRGETWRARLERFTNSKPLYEQKISCDNQQEMYSRMAAANGGLFGVFPGNSRECSRLPLAYSDYIYSIIIEETGMFGAIFVLLLYLCLLGRAGIIASKCNRAVPALLVMGMAVLIVIQALFHMAINTGLFPVSGQPLPLISSGGTSMFMTCIAFGIMLSVSRSATMGNKSKDLKIEINNLPSDMQGANQGQIN